MNKTLVAYFSASGNTAKTAQSIANAIGADLHEIKPELAYTAEDLDWNNPESRSSVEMKDPASRVVIGSAAVDMAQYSRIIVGYPIWWGVAPHIINTFLEAYDLTGKTIVPFATSAASDIGDAKAYLTASAKGAEIVNSKRLTADADKATIEAWLNA